MRFRKVIFWLHLFCGIAAGIIITIMSVTGVALTYQKQMVARTNQKLYAIQPQANAVPLTVEALVKELQKAKPEMQVTSITLSSNPAEATVIASNTNLQYLINPYSGEVLGTGAQGLRDFFRVMTDWHRWLALSGDSRNIGRAITGACNFAFLFIVVSGLYLWWPRKWRLGIFRQTAWFRNGLSAKARDYNWHHVFGFWCFVPLLLVVGGAVIMSYPWANDLLFRLAGSNPPVQTGASKKGGGEAPRNGRGPQDPVRGEAGDRNAPSVPLDLSGIDPLISRVQKEIGAWRTINFRLPTAKDKTITFNVDTSDGNRPQYRTTFILDKTDGSVVRTEAFKDQDLGRRLRMWVRFVHTGEYYGIAGQTIAGLATAAGAVLVWTGFALSIRRFASWMKKRQGA